MPTLEPFRIFIGYDSKEPVAYHVLSHSILTRASAPVSITPVALTQLRGLYTRERSLLESTEFSLSRFLVPALAGYRGVAVFMDCDMLCLADITELQDAVLAQPDKAVLVCQHDYTPKASTKFLGHPQTVYPRKNWSSLMVFNLQHKRCEDLTPEYVNTASGLDLHQFNWVKDQYIGSLPLEWNYLVGESNQAMGLPKIVHFTNGGPWFLESEDSEYAAEWWHELSTLSQFGHYETARRVCEELIPV